MDLEIALPLIWAAILAFGVFMYVVMDGFDLGVGILFNFAQSETEKATMMNSVAPIWDGNETWLILGGAGLLAAFPLAFAVILPAVYLPAMVMLIGLIFRGVAFEFRYKTIRLRWLWDLGFGWGSTLAAFGQGVILGAFIQGFEVEGRAFAGGAWDWLSPLSILSGLGLVAGYALLGSTWLIMKTEGPLQDKAYRWTTPVAVAVLFFIAVISVYTPVADQAIRDRWFTWPNMAFLAPVPITVLLIAFLLRKALEDRQEILPFILSILLFLLSYLGVAISLWPHAVPPSITIFDAASPPESQFFMLVGALALIPVILCYTAFSYYVFRGKVKGDEGYH